MEPKIFLNKQQEEFVQYLVRGMTQREAYKKAYNAKYKDTSIDNRASQLFNKPMVKERYNQLMKEVQKKLKKKTVMTVRKRMEFLSEIVYGDQKEMINFKTKGKKIIPISKEADLNTKIKAVDVLNKMDGIYTTPLSGEVKLSYESALKKVADKDEY